jgi:hypothetical protein
VLCFLPNISILRPPGHMRSIKAYTSSGFRDVSRTCTTLQSRSARHHEGSYLRNNDVGVQASIRPFRPDELAFLIDLGLKPDEHMLLRVI